MYIQQAAAARVIGILSRESKEIAVECVELGCVRWLMIAMGNNKHGESQKQVMIGYLAFMLFMSQCLCAVLRNFE